MAPKKSKKSKKIDEDEIWAQKEKEKAIKPSIEIDRNIESDHENNFSDLLNSNKSKFSYDLNQDLEPQEDLDDDHHDNQSEDDKFGGLMSTLKNASNKTKNKKQKTKSNKNIPPTEEISDDQTLNSNQKDLIAEPDVDELYPEDNNEKKNKKSKKKSDKKSALPLQLDDDMDEDELLEKARQARQEAEAQLKADPSAALPQSQQNNQVTESTGLLSKKEKERLKKEKEKAKKKAQAAAKKAAGTVPNSASLQPEPETEHSPSHPQELESNLDSNIAPPPDAEDEEEETVGGGTTSKNKKKKKKKAAEKTEAVKEEPKKKVGGKLSALRAAMEEKQRLEAEAKAKAEEEERLRIEEEQRLEAEEKRKEEEKARKKEKEKAKKEELRRAGKLLTPKQKAEKAAAELRLKALVQSGAVVVGIQEKTETASAPGSKKVSYGTRKKGPKKEPVSETVKTESVVEQLPDVSKLSVTEPLQSPPPQPSPSPPATSVPVAEDVNVKDDWEAESDHAENDNIKDDWDAESVSDDAKSQPPKKASTSSTKAQNITTSSAAKPSGSKTTITNIVNKSTSSTQKPEKLKAELKYKSANDLKGKLSNSTQAATKNIAKNAAVQDPEESEEESDSDDSDSDSDDSDEDSDESDDEGRKVSTTRKMAAQRKAEAAARRAKRHEDALAARRPEDMRSPICCILGHVDTGKTKLLDKIRQTNVQEGEAGGITQQIGATFFPMEAIKQKTLVLREHDLKEYKLPGLLMIDTPGHESFTNLRSRGSSLCNIAILVVDIMHGLEQQTLESLRLLRDKKTPFIVALNKIDRLYGWTAIKENSFRDSFSKQVRPVQREFTNRLESVIVAFAEQGLNAVPYYENTNYSKNVSLVPTSAVTGEGVPDLLMLLIKLTQERMSDRLMYLSELECTVLEVKVIEGLGTTIDVVLSNGILREGDKIVVCGLNGPIVTQVRALLTPQPMKELRIKGQYVHHKEVKASLGVKIVAPDLEKAIAGSRLLLLTEDDDEDDLKEEVMGDLTNLMNSIDKSGRGVCVQASTLGSLEALLEFLRTSKIPVSGINIGPVYKRDVMRAGTMLEKARELAVLLAFDVPVDKDAERLAEETGVKIFKADIIYHLFDAFTAYNAAILETKRIDSAPIAVWPCRLKIIQAFAKRDPIIVGCDILEGVLKVGTPLCVVKTDPTTRARTTIPLGKVTSLEINHKAVQTLKREQAGAGVAVKIEHASYQSAMTYGRQFDDSDELISQISRQSIDVLKNVFRSEVSKDEWALIVKLKKELMID
ncbi:hypothetical protein O181_015749 [Austropuccinia psidii MF-1]|uniref:Eukaryotic translation initiation factor 5B n=1 Tax=Austropuccinia psidii MF-1 TaxID=1389203 RepID=A0A9Q3GR49_9BASI|nr:hypothetical protein [Austropuccinia psidii MF-1]